MGRKLSTMKTLRIWIPLVALCLCAIVAAQSLEDEFPRAQQLFAKAQRLMRERNYPAAIDAYQELVSGYKYSEYRDLYHYGLARAYYLAGDIRRCSETLATFHSLHPNSNLRSYAYHLMANCAYRNQQLEYAVLLYSQAYRMTDDARLRSLAERSIFAAVEHGFLPSDSTLTALPATLVCPVKSRISFLMTGYWSAEKIDSFLADCPATVVQPEETTGITDDSRNSDAIVVAAMLPLSGAYAKYGQAVLDGAILAGEQAQRANVPLELRVYDTKADHLVAARIARHVMADQVDVIIGPLLSNIAATAAAALAPSRIPVIVPVASGAGFTDLSPDCYQLSPNLVTIGKGMAQYAIGHRGMTTLAVIAPATLDESTMADAFLDEARRLGARIIAVEKFRATDTDFGPYIKDIKRAILGPDADSTFYVTLDGDTLRGGEEPVSFDGLFLPCTEQQLFLLLPQLNFYRVNASYLGTSDWDTPKVIKLGEKVLGDAVFYSFNGAMEASPAFDAFAAAFDTKYGAQPDRLAALGYDALTIIADAHNFGRTGPGDISAHIHALTGYTGAAGNITLGRMRTNLELPLFTLRDERVQPLVKSPVVEEPLEDITPPDSIGTQYIEYEW